MSWIKKISSFAFLIFQLVFVVSIAKTYPLAGNLFFVIAYQCLAIISFTLIYKSKSLMLANTTILLLFVNFWVDIEATLITLPPSMLQNVKIVGDVMPGFEGVNTVSTDKLGFRTTTAIDYKRDNGVRIFAIGASTTEEIYVDDNETWTARLEAKLNKKYGESYRVVNTGVSGLRAPHHLATLNYIEDMHPDYVLFLVGVNDWNRQVVTNVTGSAKASKWIPLIGNNLVNTPLFRLWEGVENKIFSDQYVGNYTLKNDPAVIENSGQFYASVNNSLALKRMVKVDIRDVSTVYKNNMSRIANKCKKGGYKCLFITQPSAYSHKISDQLKSRLWMTPPEEAYTLGLDNLIDISTLYNGWLKKFGADSGVPVCDLAAKIEPSEKYLYDDVHFNENGSTEVSKHIFECLEDSYLH